MSINFQQILIRLATEYHNLKKTSLSQLIFLLKWYFNQFEYFYQASEDDL